MRSEPMRPTRSSTCSRGSPTNRTPRRMSRGNSFVAVFRSRVRRPGALQEGRAIRHSLAICCAGRGCRYPTGSRSTGSPSPTAPSAGRSSSSPAIGTRARGSPRRAWPAPGPGSRRGWRRRSGRTGRRCWWKNSSPEREFPGPALIEDPRASSPARVGDLLRRGWVRRLADRHPRRQMAARDPRLRGDGPPISGDDPAGARRDAGGARPPGPSAPWLPRLFAGRRAGLGRRCPDAPGSELRTPTSPRRPAWPGRWLTRRGSNTASSSSRWRGRRWRGGAPRGPEATIDRGR